MDLWLFHWLNDSAGWGYWPDYVAWFLAVYGLPLQALFAAIRWVKPGAHPRSARHLVLLALVGAVLAVGLDQFASAVHNRPRPFEIIPGAFDLVKTAADPSFPSTDATAAFTFAAVMGWDSPGWGALSWGVALGNGWARVWAGVHYPTDILGGLLIGLFAAWLMLALRPELEPALDRSLEALGASTAKKRR